MKYLVSMVLVMLMAIAAFAGGKVLVINSSSVNMSDGTTLTNTGPDTVQSDPGSYNGSAMNESMGTGGSILTWTWDEEYGVYTWTCPACGAIYILEFVVDDVGFVYFTVYYRHPNYTWIPLTNGSTTPGIIMQ